MLDEKDLQAIAKLIDMKLEPMQGDIKTMQGDIKSMQGDIKTMQGDIVGINLTLENVIQPQLNALAEGHASILEKLVPRCRVDDLEEEVRFLKVLYRQMSEEVQGLKKAQ